MIWSTRKIRQHKAERKGWVWGGKGQSSSRSLKCDMNYDDKLGVCALGNDKKSTFLWREKEIPKNKKLCYFYGKKIKYQQQQERNRDIANQIPAFVIRVFSLQKRIFNPATAAV